jgi:hypothetical protein
MSVDGFALEKEAIIFDETSLTFPWNYGERAMMRIKNKILPEKNTALEGLYYAS